MKKRRTKGVVNPVTGKALNLNQRLVCALIIKQAPVLIDKWRSSGSELSFVDYLRSACNEDCKVKGFIANLVAKNYSVVLETLIAIFDYSDFETFDTFLMYHNTRACEYVDGK